MKFIRQMCQHQHIMMTKQKTTVCGVTIAAPVGVSFKRSRKSPTVTPLTRQVMTKSIHRAILEYQHSQSICATSPKSPLDLRVRAAISRGRSGTPVKCQMKTEHRFDESLTVDGNNHHQSLTTTTTTVTTTITNKQEVSSKLTNTLETVYEQEKDPIADASENNEHKSMVPYNEEKNDIVSNGLSPIDSGTVTPVMQTRKKINKPLNDTPNADSDVWYTPKEYAQTNVIENNEVKFGNEKKKISVENGN